MRRLLKAAGERDDPVDVLVDAVVAWENLFGSTRTRSTAHPIEDTVEKKAERARSLFCVDHRAHNATRLTEAMNDELGTAVGPHVATRAAIAYLTSLIGRAVLNVVSLPVDNGYSDARRTFWPAP